VHSGGKRKSQEIVNPGASRGWLIIGWNMKFVVIAVLLAVAWAPSPQPGGAKHPAKTPKQVEQQSNNSKQVGNSPAAEPIVPTSPNPVNSESGSETSANKEQPVRITEPVAVTTKPDYATWLFSMLLVGVGALQVWLLWGTLKATRNNAEAAKDNAAAARLNAEVLMESMLPQLSVSAPNLTKNLVVGEVPRVELSIENRGTTAAHHCTWESWIEIIPSYPTLLGPAKDFSNAADHFISTNSFSIPSNSKQPVVLTIPIRDHLLTMDELNDLTRLRTFLCVRLLMGYQTVFDVADSKEERHNGFGFYVLSDGMGFLPKYTEYGKRERKNPN
jgi:hypothetical protein